MIYEDIDINLIHVKEEIWEGIFNCERRGLLVSKKWLSQLLYSLKDIETVSNNSSVKVNVESDPLINAETYTYAKSLFDYREYDRCAYFLSKEKSKAARFLFRYARYLSSEEKKINNMIEPTSSPDTKHIEVLKNLRVEFSKDRKAGTLDGYDLYLYGVILKRLHLTLPALTVLVEAVHKDPIHWGAWMELSSLITNKEQLETCSLPNHWMKHFFLAYVYLELQMNDEALVIYDSLRKCGFERSVHILAQRGIAFRNLRDVDTSVEIFHHIFHKEDPYDLHYVDVYSNLLYVKNMAVELSYLAHEVFEINKYRPETCCVIGNYYSMRSEHEKAILYFKRALKLNPLYISAWTLMGHEYMEMRNTSAAIESYRKATDVNSRDYRAWYGLGQTYDILKMPFYSLFYYKKAQELRPNDSRMIIALGETYEKLEKYTDALWCYYRARNIGCVEYSPVLRLAKLYDKINDVEHAAAAYREYVADSDSGYTVDKTELSQSYKYLANYCIEKKRLEEASKYAYKCLEFEETKDEAKSMLRSIAQRRLEIGEGKREVEDEEQDDENYEDDVDSSEEDDESSEEVENT